MPHRLDHIHLKAPDPRKTADWYVAAFGFAIVSDEVRALGDRFIRCRTADGTMVNISGARPGETLGPGDAGVHQGLEHLGLDSEDLDADIARLQQIGARLLEGPVRVASGARFAFLQAPDDVRIELIQRPAPAVAPGA